MDEFDQIVEDLLYDDEEWTSEVAMFGEEALAEWDIRPVFVQMKLSWAWN